MAGIYRNASEDSFVSDEQVKRDLLLREPHQPPEFLTPLPQPKGFDYWSARMKDRQRVYLETDENPNCVEIAFADDTLIALMSDFHVGGAETDYARIEAEVNAIVETPNAYVWLLGDEIDAFFFSPNTSRNGNSTKPI